MYRLPPGRILLMFTHRQYVTATSCQNTADVYPPTVCIGYLLGEYCWYLPTDSMYRLPPVRILLMFIHRQYVSATSWENIADVYPPTVCIGYLLGEYCWCLPTDSMYRLLPGRILLMFTYRQYVSATSWENTVDVYPPTVCIGYLLGEYCWCLPSDSMYRLPSGKILLMFTQRQYVSATSWENIADVYPPTVCVLGEYCWCLPTDSMCRLPPVRILLMFTHRQYVLSTSWKNTADVYPPTVCIGYLLSEYCWCLPTDSMYRLPPGRILLMFTHRQYVSATSWENTADVYPPIVCIGYLLGE